MKKRSLTDCLLLEAFAEPGLGQTARARQLFREIAKMEPSDIDARREMPQWKDTNIMQDTARA
ncbi:MAG: hypothetical protein ACLQMO_00185 [Acidobacteriaceae bacterium]